VVISELGGRKKKTNMFLKAAVFRELAAQLSTIRAKLCFIALICLSNFLQPLVKQEGSHPCSSVSSVFNRWPTYGLQNLQLCIQAMAPFPVSHLHKLNASNLSEVISTPKNIHF